MRIYSLTCETTENYKEAIERLKSLPQKITLRIPIQWNGEKGKIDDPNDYLDVFRDISAVSDIMIEFVDSDAMKHFSPDSYGRHVGKCLEVLGRYCKIGEAGNEVNGSWLTKEGETDTTAEKVRRALTACNDAGLPTAVTYYLSADEPRQMFDWIDANPLTSNYALISYYKNSSPGFSIDPVAIFEEFGAKFRPPYIVGWGEYGTQKANGKNPFGKKERIKMIEFFEHECWNKISPKVDNYAGFGGYWDWAEDEFTDETFKTEWR